MVFIYAENRAQFLAATLLWDEIKSFVKGADGLGCGAPPRWFGYPPADSRSVTVKSLSEYPLSPELAARLRVYSSSSRELIDRYVNRVSGSGYARRRVITLGSSLSWLATAVTCRWSQREGDVSLILAETAEEVSKQLESEGEVIVLARAHDLTHGVLDECAVKARSCDVGFLTARRLEDITWHWYKPLLWQGDSWGDCVFINGETRLMQRWRRDGQGDGAEPVTTALLERVLSKRLLLLSLMGHGSGIDMDLGGSGLLCGRTGRALQMAAKGELLPFCADEAGSCLRNKDNARRIFPADEISAALLFANTCLGVALADSNYNLNLSMGLGLADGPTGALLASHRVRYVDHGENVLVESCLQSGMSAGAIARVLNTLIARKGEPGSFILLGRPDFRPVPPGEAHPVRSRRWPEGTECPDPPASTGQRGEPLRVTEPPPKSTLLPALGTEKGSEAARGSFHLSEVQGELLVYGKVDPRDVQQLRPAMASQREIDWLIRLWRALHYWKAQLPLLCKVAGDDFEDTINREFAKFEQALMSRMHVLHKKVRKGLRVPGAEFCPAVAEQAGRLSDILNPLVAKIIKVHGVVFIDRLFRKLTRTVENEAPGTDCGCGKRRRVWRLHSLLSADVERWCRECASCGITLDAPRPDIRLSYVGSSDIKRGEEVAARWLWTPSDPPTSMPRLHTVLRNNLCDTTAITVTPLEGVREPDGSYSFGLTIKVKEDATPEAYWFWGTVLADLELTCSMQRLRIHK